MKKERILVMALLIAIAFMVCGCQEEQKVWGRGNPPAEWQEYFGNDNTARLDFIQTEAVKRQEVMLYGGQINDPNGKPIKINGIVSRLIYLESENPAELARRVGKLETEINKLASAEHTHDHNHYSDMTEAEREAGWDNCWTDKAGNRNCEAAMMNTEESDPNGN